MPGKGRKGMGGKDSCILPFHYSISQALVAGVFTAFASPAIIPRAALEADVWAHFRLRKLAFRLLPTSPSTAAQAAGFVGGVQDTNPGTYAQVVELISSCIKGIGQTVPSSWVRVSRQELAGPFPWYKTVAGTADSTEEAPGVICVVGTGTEVFNIEFRGEFEFKVGLSSGNTPLEVKLRELVRKQRVDQMRSTEREVLLKILAASDSTKMPP